MAYNKSTYRKERRFRDKSLRRALFVTLILIAGSLWVVTFFALTDDGGSPGTTGSQQPSVNSASVSSFTTSYFQFQTDKNWHYIVNESSDNVFVYRRLRNGIIQANIMVYVDAEPPRTRVTRVLPVSKDENSYRLKASFVSEHCRNSLPNNLDNSADSVLVTHHSVSFDCDHASDSYSVVVGLENATSAVKLRRPNGSSATYMIYYEDLRYDVDSDEFADIINTFEIR